MDLTASLQMSKETTVDSGVATEGSDSSVDETFEDRPPPVPLSPPPDDSSPTYGLTNGGDNTENGANGDIRYKLMDIYKHKVEARVTSNKGTISSVTDATNDDTLSRVTSPPYLDELPQEGIVENGETAKNGCDSSINVDVTDSHVTICDKHETSTKNGPNSYTKLSYCACIINVFVGLIALAYSLKSKDAWREGNRHKAWSNGLNALFCSLFAILTVVAIVVIVLWLEVFT